ncbi:MAG TPA: hypothetical protein ENN38_00275 [Actinobacteria bacterium]|nr:hypothetical protein [Actinomycetota bacterium]
MKVGVPRALLYYKYFPLWETFFSELGAEVVLSSPTNKRILNLGTEAAENEVCLPVKIFYGHVISLKDKVDALFIPRIVSVEGGAYTCPKFLGLPDMIRALDVDLPQIISPTFNLKLGLREFYRSVYELGGFFTKNLFKIVMAFQKGLNKLDSFENLLHDGHLLNEALAGRFFPAPKGRLRIGVVGHPYNIFDQYISMNLIERLQKKGIKVLTAEMVEEEVVDKIVTGLQKKLFWTYEKDVVGAVFHWLDAKSVDGIIYVLSFACGPDSLIQILIEHEAKQQGFSVPIMPIVIDEHSGEAGLVTRLEAFVDMMSRKVGSEKS